MSQIILSNDILKCNPDLLEMFEELFDTITANSILPEDINTTFQVGSALYNLSYADNNPVEVIMGWEKSCDFKGNIYEDLVIYTVNGIMVNQQPNTPEFHQVVKPHRQRSKG